MDEPEAKQRRLVLEAGPGPAPLLGTLAKQVESQSDARQPLGRVVMEIAVEAFVSAVQLRREAEKQHVALPGRKAEYGGESDQRQIDPGPHRRLDQGGDVGVGSAAPVTKQLVDL